VAPLSQGRTSAVQCGLFTHKSVPVIFEPPCSLHSFEVLISLLVSNDSIYFFLWFILKSCHYLQNRNSKECGMTDE
jgi:hypothetical protein